jgi:hypothetical protein
VDPTLIAVEVDLDPPPVSSALHHPPGLAQHELAHLLRAQAGLGKEWHDRGSGDDAGQEGRLSGLAVGCPAAQALHSVTPWKVQMRQMKVPQLLQG